MTHHAQIAFPPAKPSRGAAPAVEEARAAPVDRWRRWVGPAGGIQRRLLGLVAVACAAVGLITGAALTLQWHSLEQAAQVEARNLALSLAQTMSASTSHTLHFLPGTHGVDQRDLFVLDRQRRTLASVVPAEIGSLYVDDKSTTIDDVLRDGMPRSFTETSSQHPDGARFMAVAVRASAAPDAPVTGVLALESSRLARQLIADSAPRLYAIALTGLAVMLGVALAGTRWARRLSTSIEDLRAGVDAFAEGHLGTRLAPQGPAEVAALGRAFNAMAETLEQTTFELRLESAMAKEAAAQVERLAFTDPVTGLGNRASLSRLLSKQIAWAAASDRGFALLMLGLDRFRNVNDSLGHGVGDELLGLLGERLQAAVGAHRVVVRLGSDEFALLLDELDPAALGATARHLIDTLGAPCRIRGNELRLSASVGVALCPKDGGNEETLMRHADIAMHNAKEDGGGTFKLYAEDLNRHSVERLAFEAALRQAVEAEALSVHYQPKVSAHTGLIEGVEALVRWKHPQLGSISPVKFIPIAEETGLIVPLGRWVMRQACEQLVAWQREGLPAIGMAINLSPAQFRSPSMLADIDAAIADSGVDPTRLEFEITESMLMQDGGRTAGMLRALKARGVRLAVDDFSTGYSSLSQLRSFPVDTLKIDRSFVRGIADDIEDRAIAQAIVQMARTLRLKVVAEGVETDAQERVLGALGCDLLQGFLYSPGVPASELEAMLRRETDRGEYCAQAVATLTGLEVKFAATNF
ncbi:putative bifunctional diguanylate cyclase/phosphodiesterase [Roseateles chitinivorans]|uniref:putative bifunctional diguanylate cyclase/phosphodiesterase n=1 Tax=Roseateles chitinivorans TaxID=2917965 RepID=UPI003D67CD29